MIPTHKCPLDVSCGNLSMDVAPKFRKKQTWDFGLYTFYVMTIAFNIVRFFFGLYSVIDSHSNPNREKLFWINTSNSVHED